MKEETLTTKDMLSGIGSMRNKALALKSSNKAYSDFLDHLLATDYFYDEDIPYPNLKQLAKECGITYEKVRKFIKDIYHDLALNYETRPVFSFKEAKYVFILSGMTKDRYLSFEIDTLPVIPRVGEEVNIPFFYAHLREAHFYVEDLKHEFSEDAQVVKIWLKPGPYNSYWHFRKDQAKEQNELPFNDWFHLDEYELKRKLKVGRF